MSGGKYCLTSKSAWMMAKNEEFAGEQDAFTELFVQVVAQINPVLDWHEQGRVQA